MRFTEKDDFLGYAIPQTNAVGDKQINIALLGKSDNLDEASVTVICQNYIVGEPIRQFGRIEDVLEKHDVGSAEELDLILEGLAKVHQENERLRGDLSELRCNLNAKVEQERKRIDVLCRDIECKFNRYFTELKAQCSTIVSDVPTLKVNRYEENAPIHPAIAEFGEIEVEPLRLRFVRGYKE